MSIPQVQTLDAMVSAARAGIERALAQVDACEDPGEAAAWLEAADTLAYDAASAFQGKARNVDHLAAGLEFAELALQLRTELESGPQLFAAAHAVRGQHLLALGRALAAAEAFSASLACERVLARAAGADPDGTARSPASLLMAAGLLGLARERSGDNAGRQTRVAAEAALRVRTADADASERAAAAAALERLVAMRL